MCKIIYNNIVINIAGMLLQKVENQVQAERYIL